MRFRLLGLLFLLVAPCGAEELVFTYAPSAVVDGDVEEDDLIANDDYTYLSLSPGIARSFRWQSTPSHPLFVEYLWIDTEGHDGEVQEDEYQSLTIGYANSIFSHTDGAIAPYGRMGLGVGVSRFNLDYVEYFGLASVFLEGGLSFGNGVTAGLGVKYHVSGYPSETAADAGFFYLSIGLVDLK